MKRALGVTDDGFALYAADTDGGTFGYADEQLRFVFATASGDIDPSTSDADVAANGDATAPTDDNVGCMRIRLVILAVNGQSIITLVHVDAADLRLGSLDGHGHLVTVDDRNVDVCVNVADVEGLSRERLGTVGRLLGVAGCCRSTDVDVPSPPY